MRIINKYSFTVFFFLCTTSFLFSQTFTNVPFLTSFAAEKEQAWKESNKRAVDFARANNLSLLQKLEDGTIIQLIDVVNGKPVYQITDNVGAAITTRAFELWEGGSTGLNITGEGYDRLGEWDGGAVRLTHQEFNNEGSPRVIQVDGATSLSDHATHVAGTLIAGGVNANAKGMNYKGMLKAHDWNNAESEMALAASVGLELSNHSYGYITGWYNNNGNWIWYGDSTITNQEDYRFGFYGDRSQEWDMIAYNAPNYLIVKSAGNDRGQGPSNAGQGGLPPVDGGSDGFDCVGDGGTAKNMMAIGAVNQVSEYTGPSSVVMSSFSGWGPADDGRIKPDVVAKGVGTYSAGSNSNTSYSSKSGTSMASPNAAGTMALLQQHYQQTHNGIPMRSSTLKGLVIHTADEAGPATGPDYMFGWGLINAERAAGLISEDDVLQNSIDEMILANNDSIIREINAAGNLPLRVTVCWTDPAGNVLEPAWNDRTPSLVHDLDLKLIGPDGELYFPYRLDPDNPTAPPSTDGKNFVDNTEQVFIAEPLAGTYTIVINHDGELTSDQVFSLIVSGMNEYQGVPFCSEELTEPVNGSDENLLNLSIRWEQAAFAVEYLVYFGTDGEGIQTPGNIFNGVEMTDNFFVAELEPNSTYFLKVVPVNTFGANEECEIIWSFSTVAAISEFPYLVDVEDVATPDLPELWQQLQYSSAKWVSTNLISFEGAKGMGCFNSGGMILTDLDNWLISPPIMVEAGKEYNISFYYRAFLPGTTEQISLLWGNSVDSSAFTVQLLELSGFDGASDWLFAETLLIPETTTFGYLAWHAESIAGYGVFIDRIALEDWGTVNLSERNTSKANAHYTNGQFVLRLPAEYSNAVLTLYSADGRNVFTGRVSGEQFYSKVIDLPAGIYVVAIEGNDWSERIKMLVRK